MELCEGTSLAAVLREVLAAGAMPLVLGGDHSLALPTLRVLSERFGSNGYAVVHFDTHADTAPELYGVRLSHASPFRVAVEEGYLDGGSIVQVGLRGYWPPPETLDWICPGGVDRRSLSRKGNTGTTRPYRNRSVKSPTATVMMMKVVLDRQLRPHGRRRFVMARRRRRESARTGKLHII